MKPLIVQPFPTHYTVPLLRILQRDLGADVIFFSEGNERYWQSHLNLQVDGLTASRCTGRTLGGGLTVNPQLLKELSTRRYDVLSMTIDGRTELATCFGVARARKIPTVLWTGMWWHPQTSFHRLTWPAMRRLYLSTDALVVYGSHVRSFLLQVGVPAERIFVAEHSVENDLYMRHVDGAARARIRERVEIAPDRSLVICVGRLVPEKGLGVLISAIGALSPPAPVLAVVGTGPCGPELESLARDLSVDLVLLGAVPPNELPDFYAAADVVALPSVTTPVSRELWGVTVNEAMCQARPVLVTDAVGAAAGGLVVDGVTGLVVPEQDVAAMRGALERLLVSPELRGRLGAAALERVARNTHERMAAVFADAFAWVTRPGRSGTF